MKTLSILLHFVMILFLAHTDAVACSLNPTAKILTDPEGTVFYHGNAVVLDGSTSTANCGSIDQYRWQIDDVTVSWSSVYSHTFNLASGESERVYKVQLRVRNTAGKYGYKTIYVTVTRNNKSFYYLTDHLGSVRVTVNEQGDPVGWDDYYPFGLVMPGRSSNSGNPNDNYKYTGHELDNEANLDLYYAGARYLDPVLGRWLSVDPYAAKFPNLSPYNYSFNNPINFYDPNGLYPIYIVTRSYAPFKSFGPSFARYHGDNRGHSLSRSASYRTSATINYDTETMHSSVTGGRSYSRRVGASEGTYSDTYVSNRSRGNNLDVHSYGNNADQPGSWDIDQFTKLSATIDGDIGSDHILNISGTISGDDFPNQESILYDSEGNALWLGNFATSGDKAAGPLFDLARKNEGDVNINVNINIKVNADGVFQGVMLGDELLSIEEWNKRFE